MSTKVQIRNALVTVDDVFVELQNNGDDTFRVSVPGHPEVGYDVKTYDEAVVAADAIAVKAASIKDAQDTVAVAVSDAVQFAQAAQEKFDSAPKADPAVAVVP